MHVDQFGGIVPFNLVNPGPLSHTSVASHLWQNRLVHVTFSLGNVLVSVSDYYPAAQVYESILDLCPSATPYIYSGLGRLYLDVCVYVCVDLSTLTAVSISRCMCVCMCGYIYPHQCRSFPQLGDLQSSQKYFSKVASIVENDSSKAALVLINE